MWRFCLMLVLIAVAWAQDYDKSEDQEESQDKLKSGHTTYCGRHPCDDEERVCLAKFQGPYVKSRKCMPLDNCMKNCDETEDCCCYLPGIFGGMPPSHCIMRWREDIESQETINCFTRKGLSTLQTFPEMIATHCRITKNRNQGAGRSDVKCRDLYKKGGCCCNNDGCNETLEKCLENPYIPEPPHANPAMDS